MTVQNLFVAKLQCVAGLPRMPLFRLRGLIPMTSLAMAQSRRSVLALRALKEQTGTVRLHRRRSLSVAPRVHVHQ